MDRQCPNRHPRRRSLQCSQKRGWSSVPTAPTVPPEAVQYLWGRPGPLQHPLQRGNQAPSSNQDRQGEHCWSRGHGRSGPCICLPLGCSCHPASPNQAPPSSSCSCTAPAACSCARAKTQRYFCSRFLAAVEMLLLHPKEWGLMGGRWPGPGEPVWEGEDTLT